MKKFIILITSILVTVFLLFISIYVFGFYINTSKKVLSFTSNDSENIYVNGEKFIVKGVNLGSGIPGYYATDFHIDKKTYKRWFKQIQEMGANTIRVYTILSPDFYDAFYEYNKNNKNPLYLIHGVWVDDYILNSKNDATVFKDDLLDDSKVVIDIIHGRKYLYENGKYSSGLYTKDISKWVLGYIIGVEWEDVTVSYTDNKYDNYKYEGKYLSTKEDTTPFVNMLAYIGDNVISYESKKYGNQRLVAFSNWPTTDPFDYDEEITNFFSKCAKVDVEQIEFNDNFIGGTFASYHVYPYYPAYLLYEKSYNKYIDKYGRINTYEDYLIRLNEHHTIPVLISEFGVSTGRGMAQQDENTNYNQGNMNENEQGKALVSMYNSIMYAGSAGAIVFTWQDEWFKRTWNTMQNVNLNFTPYWSDVQTNEQYFGLLSFDPGHDKSISYIDGDISEWNVNDIVVDDKNKQLFMKYDEKYIYIMANIKNISNQKIYIPIDITPNSGSKKTNISSNLFNRDVDFLIEIDGKDNSRMYVHEYYDALNAVYSENITGKNIYFNPPKKDSNIFNKINLILKTDAFSQSNTSELFETGKLKYGNGNPENKDFDSLADFIINNDIIELRIPWQLLNFSNPSKMMIHDDYYKNYGITEMNIDKLYIGLGYEDEKIDLKKFNLEEWNKNVTYHERLKQSYFILKDYWTSGDK